VQFWLLFTHVAIENFELQAAEVGQLVHEYSELHRSIWPLADGFEGSGTKNFSAASPASIQYSIIAHSNHIQAHCL
jgi:hypothetical protein